MGEKKKRWRPSLTAYRSLEKEVAELKTQVETLEKSNGFMEMELQRMQTKADGACQDYHRARREVLWLRSRNLWQRIVNRKYKEEEN